MWTPNEVRKLIAQLSGIGFCAAGVWLLIKGVSANGTIDITSSALSGKIESGSAGLFLTFLGFLLVLLPAIFGKHIHFPQVQNLQPSENDFSSTRTEIEQPKRYLLSTLTLIATTFILLFLGSYVENTLSRGIGALLVFAGACFGLVSSIMLIAGLISWSEPKSKTDKKDLKVEESEKT
jgi:hypothetical protein